MSVLPRRCRRYLASKRFSFSEHAWNGQAAVVIEGWRLPEGKYDHEEVALLLLLPDGYPDAAPDMFYVFPWIKVKGKGNWPNGAAGGYQFQEREWQQWSRHWSDWRPGVDGMPTWLLKVRHALDITA